MRLRSDSILMLVALTSPSGDYNNVYMQNYATLNILDELRQVPGVGNARCWGAASLPCGSGWIPTNWPSTT